jgi:hypothetical protein
MLESYLISPTRTSTSWTMPRVTKSNKSKQRSLTRQRRLGRSLNLRPKLKS